MRPSARLVLATLLASLLAGCGNGGPDHLAVSPTHIDFGRMLQGDVAEQSVTLTNGGPDTVTITGTSFNCSCFKLHPFGRLLHAGEARTLTVRFFSGDVGTGPLRGKRLDIVSTDPKQPRLQVELVGEIVRTLTVLPGKLKLGTLGDPPSLKPKIVRVRPGPGMTVELVRHRIHPEDQLQVEVTALDGGFDFSVRWAPPATQGQGHFLGSLEIRTRVTGPEFEARELEHVVRIHGEWPPR